MSTQAIKASTIEVVKLDPTRLVFKFSYDYSNLNISSNSLRIDHSIYDPSEKLIFSRSWSYINVMDSESSSTFLTSERVIGWGGQVTNDGIYYLPDLTYRYTLNTSNILSSVESLSLNFKIDTGNADTKLFASQALNMKMMFQAAPDDLPVTISNDTLLVLSDARYKEVFTGNFTDALKTGSIENLRLYSYEVKEYDVSKFVVFGSWDYKAFEAAQDDDVSLAFAGNDYLSGTPFNDYLIGGAGDDIIFGNEGNDILDGGTGNDYLAGGSGDDVYYIDSYQDQVVENANAGVDTIWVPFSYTLQNLPNVEILALSGTGNFNLTGNSGSNFLLGNSGNNVFNGLGGNDQINGGGGIDTLIVTGLPSQYKFSSGTSSSTGTLTGVDGVDTLTSIEFIRFGASLGNDLFISDLMPSQLVDPDGNGPRLSPVNELIKSFSVLYIAYFNRSPDIEGFMYWFKELNSGNMTLSQVSSSFTQQPEYRAAYPAGSSNREFIAQIYQNLFDRTPDTEGWNFWENTLNAGSPRDVFILTVINGAYAPTGGAGDRALLDNKHAVSLHYTEQLSSFPTEAFDRGISTVLNRVTENPATVNQGLAVIDHVMDNPITLTGLINDAQAFNAYWSA